MIRFHELIWHEVISEEIWGWVCYSEPLTQEDLDAFGMIPDEDNPVRYRQYGVARTETKTNADGKRTVKRNLMPDETGRPMATSYKRKALIMLFELRRDARRAGITNVEYSIVKVVRLPEK